MRCAGITSSLYNEAAWARGVTFPISVLIVGDIRLYCEGLGQLLREAARRVIAVATSIDETVARLTEDRPDVILVDMAVSGSPDLVRATRGVRASLPIIGLAIPESEPEIVACARGAKATTSSRFTVP